jgi:class 3 adenylate cyclase
MQEANARFDVLRQSAEPAAAAAIERLVREGADADLNRINVLEFAGRHGLGEEAAIAAFLHASRLGLFELQWNILCPGCGGVLDSNAKLKTLDRESYPCALCHAGYEPTLDEMVEVSFTVSPRVRRIGAHDPHSLPLWDYVRQMYWGSGLVLPEGEALKAFRDGAVMEELELPAGEKVIVSLQLPAEFVIVFEPVTHAAHFIDVQGEPTKERQELSLVYNKVRAPTGKTVMQPGPLRLTLDNKTDVRTLPMVFIAGHVLHEALKLRKKFLTAKRLLTNQTFRDLYQTETLEVDQRLKITSLTFLFTDLKGSTELYDRVGDLVAFDLVRSHFKVLHEIVASEAGAVVKTIGDAVMATFPTPERAVAAALRMREAMLGLNASRGHEDFLLKIGIHEGPCLAVSLNDRLDYFGQTVNIAARVQALTETRAIYATQPVVSNDASSRLLGEHGLTAEPRQAMLRGIASELTVFEIK